MANRCPDCGRLLGEGSSSDGFCWRRGDKKCRALLVSNLRAKLTKLEALVAAQAKVIALGEARGDTPYSQLESRLAAYDAAKAELEKVRD